MVRFWFEWFYSKGNLIARGPWREFLAEGILIEKGQDYAFVTLSFYGKILFISCAVIGNDDCEWNPNITCSLLYGSSHNM